MKTRAIGGGLGIWLGVVAIVAPAGMAQDDPPIDAVSIKATDDGPTTQEAQNLLQAGRWEEAAAAWGAVVAREPSNGQAVFYLGYCLHMAERLDEALKVHIRAAEFDEYRGIALYNAGCAHAQMGDADEAIKALTGSQEAGFSLGNALEDPDLDSLHGDPRFEALLAQSHSGPGVIERLQQIAGQGRMMYTIYAPEIRRNLDDVHALAEMYAQGLVMRIMRDERLGPIAMRAMQFVQGSESAGPQDARPRVQDGAVTARTPSVRDAQRLQQKQDWAAAADVFAAVLANDPENLDAVFGHAYSLHMNGDYGAAIKAHKRAATFPQLRATALYNLGCAYSLTGDADKAFEAIKSSIEAGFEDMDLLKTDSDLDNLREDPRFPLLLSEISGGQSV